MPWLLKVLEYKIKPSGEQTTIIRIEQGKNESES